MRNRLLLSIFLGLFAASLHAEETIEFPTPPFTFGGGVDYKNACSNIDDRRACDMANLVATTYGAIEKRNGSSRYVSQAVSTASVAAVQKFYVSSAGVNYQSLIMVSRDRIYQSTGDTNPVWVLISSGLSQNRLWSSASMNGKAILTNDALVDSVKAFDLATTSMTDLMRNDGSSSTVVLRAKYVLESNNYLILANVADVTSGSPVYYPNRIYYSLLVQPSSFTALRFEEIRTTGRDEITGLFNLNGAVEIAFPNDIYSMTFTKLDLAGDQDIDHIVSGFGVIAPGATATDGKVSFLWTSEGIVRWDGGRKNRLTIKEETDVISTNIQPVIERVMKAKTYPRARGAYYPKRQWYVLCYEDPELLPRGVNNACMAYDLVINEWFPIRNWTAASLGVEDGFGDDGDLLYGDSQDSYVYYADKDGTANDARREKSIDPMDSTTTASGVWLRAIQDTLNVKEGTASLRINAGAGVSTSSMTKMDVFDFSAWQDLRRVTLQDKLSFKVFVASNVGNIGSIRVDLEVNDEAGSDFDANFTSVTVSSSSLAVGWNTIELALSSFTILSDWTSLSVEDFPDAGAQVFFGLRFVVNVVSNTSVSFDDLRLAQKSQRPLSAFRLSKQYNFGKNAQKSFKQILLDAEASAHTRFTIDSFLNFGKNAKTVTIEPLFARELWVSGYNGTENITSLDAVDFSVRKSTQFASVSVAACRSITDDEQYVYCGDRMNNRIIKIDKSSTTVFVSTFGSSGTGTNNFNNAWQHTIDATTIRIADMGNHRVKVHDKNTLAFKYSYGSLGTDNDSLHLPTGIATDDVYDYVGDDGNARICKYIKGTSSASFVLSSPVNIGTFGSLMLKADEESIFAIYNTISSTGTDYLNVVLEKRRKSDLGIVNSTILRPKFKTVQLSSYIVMGEPALMGDFIYVSFTDDFNGNGTYYIQKLLKDDFTLVEEYSSRNAHYGLSAGGLSYSPKRKLIKKDLNVGDGNYIQFRISEEDQLDNPLKIYGQSHGVILKAYSEANP